jgi:hypothetical protein
MPRHHAPRRFTSADVYLFDSLAGIRVHPSAVAFDRVVIQPRPPSPSAGLSWVNASITTVRGVVGVAWELNASGSFRLQETTPPNMDVEVVMPDGTSHSPGSGTHVFECDACV